MEGESDGILLYKVKISHGELDCVFACFEGVMGSSLQPDTELFPLSTVVG